MLTKRFVVRGLVQGVSYRVSTQKQAIDSKLLGWVKNLPNGDVEVVVSGEPKVIDHFEKWLWKGPEYAIVSKVDGEEINLQKFTCFEIRY